MTTIDIDLNEVLGIEDVQTQKVNSIETYIIELEWVNELIRSHIQRCEYYRDKCEYKEALGKLHTFLHQFEAV